MKKSVINRISAFFISMCVIAGMLPISAEAAPGTGSSSAYSFNLNRNGAIGGIGTPLTDGTQEWTGSKVYFGSLDGKPLLWRVLNPGAFAGEKSAILLQTDKIIKTMAFDSTGNTWADSSVRAYLNGTGDKQFLNGFSEAERHSICQKVTKAADENTVQDGLTFTNPALKEDTVFLLSAKEAIQTDYGYKNAGTRKLVSSGDSAGQWWMRSAVAGASGDSLKAGIVNRDGKLEGLEIADGSAAEAGLAPALYLDTSRILFTTPAGRKPDSFSEITEVTGSVDWKLTLTQDGGLDAGLSGSNTVFLPKDTVTVSHKAATGWKSGATQVSALLTDEGGKALYYGKINSNNAVSSNIMVPEGLLPGNYKLYVFAEQVNGEKSVDYASNLGGPVNITVKLPPEIVVLPGAAPITYGQSLADSVLSGGSVKSNGSAISGRFTWKDSSVKPGVADSQTTSYEVIFTPDDTTKYVAVSTQIKLQVNKIQEAPNKPGTAITVDYGVGKVKQVSLPQGWAWRAEDVEKELTAGGSIQAIARYQDTVNYANYEVAVTISRNSCTHTGGTATCTKQAVCSICSQAYGVVDSNKHGVTQVRGTKSATCTEKGYTGDSYCTDCNQILVKGQEIAELGHNYTGVVTKEPAVDEDGIKTYTCSRCGHQYTENMGRHNHYYNTTKTIHWVGCVQQGEVEHSCACGDSYVEVTPALGHDFKEAITTKATTEKEGVKTFTCKRCGYVTTQTIPKLSGGSGGSNNGNSGNNGSGSSGNKGNGSVSDRMPFIKGNSSISGWTGINKEIGKAADGDTVNISMNDSLILPSKTLEIIKGKNVTLVLDIGNNIKWSLCGKDITADSLKDINLKVTKNSNSIPSDLVSSLAGDLDTMQLSLAHEGEFGCTAQLQVLLDAQKPGYYANLFYYNKDTKALDYMSSTQMDGKGIAGMDLTHASDYLVVMDTDIMDGTRKEEPETTPSSQPEETPETVPVDNPEPVPEQQSRISIVVIIIIGLAVLALGLILIFILRARSKQKEEEYDETE